MTKKQKVLISVEAIERTGEMQPSIASQANMLGELEKKGTGYILTYDENLAENAAQAETTQVKLHVSRNRVMMVRRGDFSTVMVFDRLHPYSGMYRTPFGEVPVYIQTICVDSSCDDESGKVHMEYEMSLEGQFSSYRIINIYYAPQAAMEMGHE